MQRFFSSLSALESYTQTLDSLPIDDTCQHCLQNSQWVSHGYVYKQRSSAERVIVAKRILCSCRYGRKGCGHTRQLYLNNIIPRRRYSIDVLIAFVFCLLQSYGVEMAYRKALQKPTVEARHAWRWVTALFSQLSFFRCTIGHRDSDDVVTGAPLPSPRLHLLLPTVAALDQRLGGLSCFQLHAQTSLMP